MIKVLWLTNTPCNAKEILASGIVSGGWLNALETELSKSNEIELHIMFYWGVNLQPFSYLNSFYHPLYRKGTKNKFLRFINRLILKNNDGFEIQNINQKIQNIAPDIIHIHGTEENFGLINKNVLNPQVISIQGLLLPLCEKFFSGFSYHEILKNEAFITKAKLSSISTVYRRFKSMASREKQILLNAKNIIGRTNWDKRVTRVIAPESSYFVNNEIMRDGFYSNQWNNCNQTRKYTIVTIISSGYYKGLETLVKTATILKEYNTVDFCWKIIGQNEDSDYSVVVKKILKCNYQKLSIEFLGIKNEKEVIGLMLSSDLYCQVSHIENSPNSVCEAMLLGMPVIASFAGGTDSIIDHNKTGLLVQDGDPYSFAGAIFELIDDKSLAISLAQNAYKTAHKRHSKTLISEQLIDIYKSIIKNSDKNEV